ncbi:MAG: hypothetical protein ACI8QS_001961 [Planctomycetota bacterium]|jgi:hypothetical protein
MKFLATLLLIILLGAIALAFWGFNEGLAQASSPSAVSPESRVGNGGGASAELVGLADEKKDAHPVRLSTGVAEAPQPSEVAPWGELDGDAVEVRVVRADDQSIVTGATVHQVRPDDDIEDRVAAQLLRTEDLDLFLARYSMRFPANDQGIARVPAGSTTHLYAFAPGLAGGIMSSGEEEEVLDLPVHPDFDILVRVEGPNGRVADIDIELATKPDRRGRSQTIAERRSNEEGLARFTHGALLVRNRWDPTGRKSYVMRLDIPLAEPVHTEVPALDELNGGPGIEHEVVVQAPGTGRISVLVLGEGGEAFAATGKVLLTKLGSNLDEQLRNMDDSLARVVAGARNPGRRELVGGRAVFEHVGLGLELGVQVSFEEERDPAAELVRGPVVDGGAREVELVVGPIATVLVGQLVDVSGAPLLECKFDAVLHHDNGQRSWKEVTNEEGNFRLRFQPEEVPEQHWSLSLLPTGPEQSAEGEELETSGEEAFYETPFAPVPGENDLGRLISAPRPLLASGHVIDEKGKGIGGVTVSTVLLLTRTHDPDETVTTELGSWSPHIDHVTESDDDGSFELYGRLVTVRTWPGWTSQPVLAASGPGITGNKQVPFTAGDTDLELMALIAGTLKGSFLIEDSTLLNYVRVSLRNGIAGNETSRGVRLDGADFQVDGLLPGAWDLIVESKSRREEILRITGIHVPRGGEADDERLDAVDLSALRLLRLDLTSSSGDPLEGIKLARKLPGDTEWRSSENMRLVGSDGERKLEVITAHPGLDLYLTANRHRPLEVINISDDRTLVLQGGIPVTLSLDPALASLLGTDTQLLIQIQKEGLNERPQYRGYQGDRSSVTQRIPEVGSYQVTAYLFGNRGGRGNRGGWGFNNQRTYSGISIDQTISIHESTDPLSFRLEITREMLVEALEAIGQ